MRAIITDCSYLYVPRNYHRPTSRNGRIREEICRLSPDRIVVKRDCIRSNIQLQSTYVYLCTSMYISVAARISSSCRSKTIEKVNCIRFEITPCRQLSAPTAHTFRYPFHAPRSVVGTTTDHLDPSIYAPNAKHWLEHLFWSQWFRQRRKAIPR